MLSISDQELTFQHSLSDAPQSPSDQYYAFPLLMRSPTCGIERPALWISKRFRHKAPGVHHWAGPERSDRVAGNNRVTRCSKRARVIALS